MNPEHDARNGEYLTTVEAAAYIGLSKQFLEAMRWNGDHSLPFIRVGRAVRYRRSALDNWMQHHESLPASPAKACANGEK